MRGPGLKMAADHNSDVGRAMAALNAPPISYRSFPTSIESVADRVAAFPLLAAALPEFAQADHLFALPTLPERGGDRPDSRVPSLPQGQDSARSG